MQFITAIAGLAALLQIALAAPVAQAATATTTAASPHQTFALKITYKDSEYSNTYGNRYLGGYDYDPEENEPAFYLLRSQPDWKGTKIVLASNGLLTLRTDTAAGIAIKYNPTLTNGSYIAAPDGVAPANTALRNLPCKIDPTTKAFTCAFGTVAATETVFGLCTIEDEESVLFIRPKNLPTSLCPPQHSKIVTLTAEAIVS